MLKKKAGQTAGVAVIFFVKKTSRSDESNQTNQQKPTLPETNVAPENGWLQY